MNSETCELMGKLVGSYARQADEASTSRQSTINSLLRHRKLPQKAWTELEIEVFLRELALMDSNNFPDQVGGGEREGRVVCPLVSRRHFGMSHGVGRSGDVTAIQPKAAGSSLANQLASALVLDAIRIAGIRSCSSCFVVPTATGMAITLCLLYLKRLRPHATKVLWSRIDQKSCFKAILTAGLEPVVIDPVLVGDELRTDTTEFNSKLSSMGDSILCCITTTSCFAPRVPDSVEEIATMCKEKDIPHLVNNAYGLQASKCCHLIEQGAKCGRVDAFIQSCDKNFLVPVGGAVIAGFDSKIIEGIAKTYPGRASGSASVDVLSTLLWLGSEGWTTLLQERKQLFTFLKEKLAIFAADHQERLLDTKNNPISLAMTLTQFDTGDGASKTLSELGSMLFTRRCTGARVVPVGVEKRVEGHEFAGWMSHFPNYPHPYLNIAGAIGMDHNEVDVILLRLGKSFMDLHKRLRRLSHTEKEFDSDLDHSKLSNSVVS